MKKNKTQVIQEQNFERAISCLKKAAKDIKLAKEQYKQDRKQMLNEVDELIELIEDLPAD